MLPLSVGLAGSQILTHRPTTASFTAPPATMLLDLSFGYTRRMDMPDGWIYPSDGCPGRMDISGTPDVWTYPSDGYARRMDIPVGCISWPYGYVWCTRCMGITDLSWYGYIRWVDIPASRPGEGQPGDAAASSAAAGSPEPGETKQCILGRMSEKGLATILPYPCVFRFLYFLFFLPF